MIFFIKEKCGVCPCLVINMTAPILYFWMTDKVRGDVWRLESLSLSKYHQGLIKICGAGGEKVDSHSGRGQLV